MSIIERLQTTFPFLGGVLLLVIGAYFRITEVQIVALGLACYGFYLMAKPASDNTPGAKG